MLACGPGTDIECPSPPTDWIWSPDDTMLIGTVYHETPSGGLTETYLLVDANTGQVTELDWVDVGTPAWQRVAPQSPSPALLARGNFVIRDWDRVVFEATREGSSVTGRMTVGRKKRTSDFFRVDLQCARTTEDGLIMIGGYTDGAGGRFAGQPEGTLAAIALKRGSPVEAQIWAGSIVNWPATQTTDCVAYLDASLTWIRTFSGRGVAQGRHPGNRRVWSVASTGR